MKTAGRIISGAAFYEGLWAQDFSIYGAERRGAPVTAYVRVSDMPILERGHIFNPNIVLVGDPNLLVSTVVRPPEGLSQKGLLFVNSPSRVSLKPPMHSIRTLNDDLTGLSVQFLGREVLSSALGAVACKLSGTISLSATERAVVEELRELGLEDETIEKNVRLARECYMRTPNVSIEFDGEELEHSIVEVKHVGLNGIPNLVAVANTASKKTGSWRVFKPVVDRELCTACGICYTFCPESCIGLDEERKPVIDYENCKGCLICLQECPRKAMSAEGFNA